MDRAAEIAENNRFRAEMERRLQTMAKDLGIREAKYKGETTKPMMDLSPSVVRTGTFCSTSQP